MLNLKEKNQFSKFMGIILWVWDRNKRDFQSDIWRKQNNTCYTISWNIVYVFLEYKHSIVSYKIRVGYITL